MPGSKRLIGDVGEFDLIERMLSKCGGHPLLLLGAGDDAAELKIPEGKRVLLTTDLLIEEIHFRRSTTDARSLGHKALAVNLSDIAAMGGQALAAFVSLALPKDLELSWLDEFYAGLNALAFDHGMVVAGGDTTASPAPLVINIALLGLADKGRTLKRNGAKVGDGLWLSGALGLSRAGFEALTHGWTIPENLTAAHLRPAPLISAGRCLAAGGRCTSCIDVSDGLLGDLMHVCKMSGVKAVVELDQLPASSDLLSFVRTQGGDVFDYLLNGGEDYALLFTLSGGDEEPEDWPSGLAAPLRIGRITEGMGIVLRDEDGLEHPAMGKGFDHFGA